MGIWDFIVSAAGSIQRNAPDVTPVKDACRSSYDYGSTAVSKVDKVVRVDGFRLFSHYWHDAESRTLISLFAAKLANNAKDYALREGYKSIPGGTAMGYIVSQTISDMKSGDRKDDELKALQDKVERLEKAYTNMKNPLEEHTGKKMRD